MSDTEIHSSNALSCRKCGENVQSNGGHCPHCGHEFSTDTVAPGPQYGADHAPFQNNQRTKDSRSWTRGGAAFLAVGAIGASLIAFFVMRAHGQRFSSDGMPAIISPIKCGDSFETLLREFPNIGRGATGGGYCLTEKSEVVCLKIDDDANGITSMMFFTTEADVYGSLLEELEDRFGKPSRFDSQEKQVVWKPDNGSLRDVRIAPTVKDGKSLVTVMFACL